ncbi:hypothetical protein FIBSPDRAFT_960379 [Athelia psychrophila]|uniref:Uncharacterized protein n=1 Tax=Athelia psychrophila TaxID=1759441 RepID=A0A166CIK3_9AGAM|nr:hypothetical protein FIBSPDRAFT_960379 [Fibularhizoctonia sp. CBS 109695]
MTAVFAAQGLGNLTAALVSLISVPAYKGQSLADSVPNYDYVLIGLGCVSAITALLLPPHHPKDPRFHHGRRVQHQAGTHHLDSTPTPSTSSPPRPLAATSLPISPERQDPHWHVLVLVRP